MSVVHIYSLPQVIRLSTGTGARYMNYPMNSTDIRLVKNVRNEVELFLKDIDRKPVVMTEPLVLRIIDYKSRSILLTAPMDLVDSAKARYRATFEPQAIGELNIGYYSYTVSSVDDDGVERALFTDRDRGETGTLRISQGPIPDPTDPIEITPDDLLNRDEFLYSGAYPGAAQVGNTSGVHTIAVYGNHFSGSITVQGSLDAQPTSDDTQWFDVATYDFADLNCVVGHTFIGNLMWVRFKISDQSSAPPPGSSPYDIDCLGCQVGGPGGGVHDCTPIDWPEGTPVGLVKILYKNN